MKKQILLSIAALTLIASKHASAFIIDGNLADWGINPATWQPSASDIHRTIEDQVGVSFLNPGYGGQAYDAEALYAKISDGKLYIALATGHDPRTLQKPTANSYGAGDFAIDFGKDGSYEVGINIKHALAATAGGGYVFESFGDEGGVYRNPVWDYGLWRSDGRQTTPGSSTYNPDPAHPTHLKGGEKVGMATLAYTTAGVAGYGSSAGDLHYFYEMSVDLQLLRDGGWTADASGQFPAFNIHWTELCANDSIIVDPPADVPEPATLALVLAGLLAGSRRGKRFA